MESKHKNPLIQYWPQLTAGALFIFTLGVNFNNLKGVATQIIGIEKEHEHDVKYLNEEDDGVRADYERADDCNKEVARLENEVLYWKLKYEFKD